jgi:hypothetical protein
MALECGLALKVIIMLDNGSLVKQTDMEFIYG